MTPGACVSAAIEILEYTLASNKQPFDAFIQQYFKQRRYAGSKDRRIILDFVYGVLRTFYKLTYLAQKHHFQEISFRFYLLIYCRFFLNKQITELEEWFSGMGHSPFPLTNEERNLLNSISTKTFVFPEWAEANIPEFLWSDLQSIFGTNTSVEVSGLNQEATVDLRVNILKTSREFIKEALKNDGIDSIETPYSPFGLRLQNRINLKNHRLYQQGLFEFQDEASQLISLLCNACETHTVLDYCAGAGGKALALSMIMNGQGSIDTYDIRLDRLKKAEFRAHRAGAQNISFLKHEPVKTYNRVLVDAPCSGIGTWRRHPEWRLTLTQQELKYLADLQLEILFKASKYVKQEGRLIYVTCSILASENEKTVNDFLFQNPQFNIIPVSNIWHKVVSVPFQITSKFLRFTPYQHKTDGFFIAILENKTK